MRTRGDDPPTPRLASLEQPARPTPTPHQEAAVSWIADANSSHSLRAIVVAGGRASRLGGLDKPSLTGPDGRTALRRALDACAAVAASPVAVVGPPACLAPLLASAPVPVVVTQEDPPGSGPALAIAAGLVALEANHGNHGDGSGGPTAPLNDPNKTRPAEPSPWLPPANHSPVVDLVLVLACDMPNAAPVVRALVQTAPKRMLAHHDGLVAYAHGHRQWLLGLYRRDALATACAQLPTPTPGEPGPSVHALVDGLDLSDFPVADGTIDDLDTPADLVRLRFSSPVARQGG